MSSVHAERSIEPTVNGLDVRDNGLPRIIAGDIERQELAIVARGGGIRLAALNFDVGDDDMCALSYQ